MFLPTDDERAAARIRELVEPMVCAFVAEHAALNDADFTLALTTRIRAAVAAVVADGEGVEDGDREIYRVFSLECLKRRAEILGVKPAGTA